MEQLQKDVCKGREFENDSYMKMFTEKMGTYFLYKAILSQSIKNTIQFLKNLIFIYIFRILLQGHKIRRHAILYFFFFFPFGHLLSREKFPPTQRPDSRNLGLA